MIKALSKKDKIVKAINSKNIIEFKYNGSIRVVEPHVIGYNKKGDYLVRGFEKSKGKDDTELFKLYKVSSMMNLKVDLETFDKAVTQKEDSAISNILTSTYEKKD